MKHWIIILAIGLMITSCYVCDTFYQIEGTNDPNGRFHDSVLTIHGWSAPGVKEWAEFYIEFDRNDSLVVKDLNLVFLNGSNLLQLDQVVAQNSKVKIEGNNSTSIRTSSFTKIPDKLRRANVLNEQSLYMFIFSSNDGNIEKESSKLILHAVLQYGSRYVVFKRRYSLETRKSCSFRMH